MRKGVQLSRVEGHRSMVKSRGRGSKVEGRKSKEVLQPLNAAKQLVLLSKLKN